MPRRLIATAAVCLVAACQPLQDVLKPPTAEGALQDALMTLTELPYEDVPGWNAAEHAEILPVLLRSCERLKGKDANAEIGIDERMGTVGQWRTLCDDAAKIRPGNKIEAKYFFETRFQPYLVGNRADKTGLFTGYYEPELRGRWSPELEFRVPIYSRPKDIVSVDAGKFDPKFQGEHLAGRIEGNELIPYYTRAEINAGALSGRELEILWVDDPVDAFFMHIQGSGRVVLKDGAHVRLGYAGRNGHRYTSIGRELVAMGQMRLDDVTAPAIRDWLKAHPVAGQDLMNRNKSFVFFRVIEGEGPIGAQGVPLTPGRSLAVDNAFIPYGVPIWLDTTDPLADGQPLRRLMVAQDTGSAIRGPVRGDVFWGFGDEAALRAGLMKQDGRYYLLLPRDWRTAPPPGT